MSVLDSPAEVVGVDLVAAVEAQVIDKAKSTAQTDNHSHALVARQQHWQSLVFQDSLHRV